MDVIVWMLMGAVLALLGVLVGARYMGFLAQTPDDYSRQGPRFDLRRHLSGPLLCEGVIYGPTGRVSSRFVADMHGTWEGDKGTLTEHFRYDSGNTQDREWSLVLMGEQIVATASDIEGEGTGTIAGSGVQLNYRIQLPADAGGHVLDVTDWMYLMENGTIMNRSQFRKFGIKVAELVATMRPAVAHEEAIAAE